MSEETQNIAKITEKAKSANGSFDKLPVKIAEMVTWRCVCKNPIGTYTLNTKDGSVLDFMCLIMIDPATGWFEIVELPNAAITVIKSEKKEPK